MPPSAPPSTWTPLATPQLAGRWMVELWGAAVSAGAHTIYALSAWHEAATPGRLANLVHCAWIDGGPAGGSQVLYYANFDIRASTWSVPIAIRNDLTKSATNRNQRTRVCISRNGNVYVGFYLNGVSPYTAFYRSTTGGASFDAARADPHEGTTLDDMYFFPADTADGADITCIYLDRSALAYSIKMYDDSANTWTETTGWSIAGLPANSSPHDNGSLRHSDGHIIFATHEQALNSIDDLHVKDITVDSIVSPSVAALTDIYSNEENHKAAVVVNQQNDDIYVFYLKTTVWQASMDVVYRLSTDGGATWGSEIAYSEAVSADVRLLDGPVSIGSQGGMIQASFFNDDLNDVFVNVANTVTIAASELDYNFRFDGSTQSFTDSDGSRHETLAAPSTDFTRGATYLTVFKGVVGGSGTSANILSSTRIDGSVVQYNRVEPHNSTNFWGHHAGWIGKHVTGDPVPHQIDTGIAQLSGGASTSRAADTSLLSINLDGLAADHWSDTEDTTAATHTTTLVDRGTPLTLSNLTKGDVVLVLGSTSVSLDAAADSFEIQLKRGGTGLFTTVVTIEGEDTNEINSSLLGDVYVVPVATSSQTWQVATRDDYSGTQQQYNRSYLIAINLTQLFETVQHHNPSDLINPAAGFQTGATVSYAPATTGPAFVFGFCNSDNGPTAPAGSYFRVQQDAVTIPTGAFESISEMGHGTTDNKPVMHPIVTDALVAGTAYTFDYDVRTGSDTSHDFRNIHLVAFSAELNSGQSLVAGARLALMGVG